MKSAAMMGRRRPLEPALVLRWLRDRLRDLIVTAVESRFGQVNRLPGTIEWLSDNGSGYIAHETRAMARDIGLERGRRRSPRSNGMAKAFVKTIERDYVRVSPLPDARTVMESLPFVDRAL